MELQVRRATDADLGAVIDVCSEALEWSNDDADRNFFRWKHLDNPFGRSPIWIAEDPAESSPKIVGVRTMMCWDLLSPSGQRHSMARAVDTATLPSHQGRGIFRSLTTAAAQDLEAAGTSAVFNTPNDKSRPGYLKMGWSMVGRPQVMVRVRHLRSLVAMARSKVAAERWGLPTEDGLSPAEALGDTDRIERLLARVPPAGGWSTPLSVDYLRWRTAFEPLGCRVQPLGPSVDDGFIVFRLRHRGQLVQLSVLEIVDPGSGRGIGRTLGRLLAATEADVALASGGLLGLSLSTMPLYKAGPMLTWRPLARGGVPDVGDLSLSLGTVELF